MAGVVRKIVNPRKGPTGLLSQAVIVGDTMYISGQLGLDPSTGKLVPGGAVPEAEQALKNMGSILKAANVDFSHVVKATVLLADIKDYAAVNNVYKKYVYFPANPPARVAYQVAALPLNGRVEIEAIAIANDIIDRPAAKL